MPCSRKNKEAMWLEKKMRERRIVGSEIRHTSESQSGESRGTVRWEGGGAKKRHELSRVMVTPRAGSKRRSRKTSFKAFKIVQTRDKSG